MDPVGNATTSRRVLIIDDNRDAADMLARLVRADGHEVRAAYTGATGLATAASFAPDIVLLDLTLPDLDGVEVARRLRTAAAATPMLIAAITGLDRDEDRERCKSEGIEHYFVKPVRLVDLRKLLTLP